jgi:hypothetical protein
LPLRRSRAILPGSKHTKVDSDLSVTKWHPTFRTGASFLASAT